MTEQTYHQWIDRRAAVIARTAQGDDYARGDAISYCDRPTVDIELPNRRRITWVADLCVADPEPSTRTSPPVLTERQRDVVRLVADGYSNAEICRALVLAMNTVKTHLAKASLALGARNRTDLVARALRTGVIE